MEKDTEVLDYLSFDALEASSGFTEVDMSTGY